MYNKETPVTAKQISEHGIQLIKQGKVRNHKLSNSAPIHTGKIEHMECVAFKNFLETKNGCFVYNITGSDNI